MAQGNAAKNGQTFDLPGLDDLFTTEESRVEQSRETIIDIPVADIVDFQNHPFKVLENEEMQELVDSIRQRGVSTPALVRPRPDGGYEMIAGHRRKQACELAGLDHLPCIVRDLSDDEAVLHMVDSNLQRETILPSEKAFAYKMRLDAMNRQGQRNDLTSTPLVSKLRTNEKIGLESGESREQIRRYIRLTELIPSLLQMVDDNKIAFRPAVELSYLSHDQQHIILRTIEELQCTPSLSQAQRMKKTVRRVGCPVMLCMPFCRKKNQIRLKRSKCPLSESGH